MTMSEPGAGMRRRSRSSTTTTRTSATRSPSCPDDPVAFLVMDGRGETLTSQLACSSGTRRRGARRGPVPALARAVLRRRSRSSSASSPTPTSGRSWRSRRTRAPTTSTTTGLSKLITVARRTARSSCRSITSSTTTSSTAGCTPTSSSRSSGRRADADEPLTRASRVAGRGDAARVRGDGHAVLTALHERTGLDQRRPLRRLLHEQRVQRQDRASSRRSRSASSSGCPDDSGTSVGAALWLHARSGPGDRRRSRRAQLLGPRVQRRRVPRGRAPVQAAERRGRRRSRRDARREDLVDGKILGWFQGRMEFGQRALGQPFDPPRPAPRGRQGRRERGDEVPRGVPPVRAGDPRRAGRRLVRVRPATHGAVHGAGATSSDRRSAPRCPRSSTSTGPAGCRPSSRDDNPRYHALIGHSSELTGVPIVLNTSFNLNGEPIVCSPDDAIRTFFTCALDVLYLGDVRVTK